ncbi:MAG: disulfide reductase [Deltaproteobacteria bacterium]|nr:MAG: disulfide reductase [Deltaproteobacteria bacterium]
MRIGVYVCHCGINIAAVVDVAAVRDYAQTLPGVVMAKDYQYMCSDPGQEMVREDIGKHNLDRVVIAACSPRMHEGTFRKVMEKGGINAYYFEEANIREQCSWVHSDREIATEKAKELVAAAVSRVHLQEALQEKEASVIPAALIIGGGIAGLTAAKDMADAGFKATLLERKPTLGGHVAKWVYTFPHMAQASEFLTPLIESVKGHPNIEVLTSAELTDLEGFVGNYQAKVAVTPRYVDEAACTRCGKCVEACPVEIPDEETWGLVTRKAIYLPPPPHDPATAVIDTASCRHFTDEGCDACVSACPEGAISFEAQAEERLVDTGVIIVATGYELFDPARKPELNYEKIPTVITGPQLERLLDENGPTKGELVLNGKSPESITFIHCVGSRDHVVGNLYCSRVCCMYTAKQARVVKERHPDIRVRVCYMDMRTFCRGCEEFYNEVQSKKVLYTRGMVSEVFTREGNPVVRFEDTFLEETMEEPTDWVVLAVGMEPPEGTEELQNLLKLSRSADGFFLEAHPKLRPVDTDTDGIFLAGCCQGPRDIADTVSSAHAAASRAAIPLFAGKVAIAPIVAEVDEEVCAGCAMCEEVCVYGALKLDELKKKMTVNEAVCKGCGACSATCPSSAIKLKNFKNNQLLAQIDALCVISAGG